MLKNPCYAGAFAYERERGRFRVFKSKTVVLATGINLVTASNEDLAFAGSYTMNFHFSYVPKGEAGAPGSATGTGTTGTTTTSGTATKR